MVVNGYGAIPEIHDVIDNSYSQQRDWSSMEVLFRLDAMSVGAISDPRNCKWQFSSVGVSCGRRSNSSIPFNRH